MARFVFPATAGALVLTGIAGLAVARGALGPAPQPSRSSPPLASPDGRARLAIGVAPDGQLTWSASLEQTPVIERSALGIVVGGTNLGAGAQIVRAVPQQGRRALRLARRSVEGGQQCQRRADLGPAHSQRP